jgi:two-component system, chemotaxis family, CheB/CheR fusion protein
MLSGSETVGDSLDLFSLVDKKNKIYSKKMAAVTQWIGDRTSDRVFTNAELQISTAKKVNDLKIQKEVDRIVLSQYAPVGVTIDTNLEIVQFSQTCRIKSTSLGCGNSIRANLTIRENG